MQGSLIAGNTPLVSALVGTFQSVDPTGTEGKPKSESAAQGANRDLTLKPTGKAGSAANLQNTLALCKIASENVLGKVITVDSFEDILRLREDPNIIKIRRLLQPYLMAVNLSDLQTVHEIEREIADAKSKLSLLKFKEHPAYLFVMKPLAYVPVIGTVVSLLNDAIDVVDRFLQKRFGWIRIGQ